MTIVSIMQTIDSGNVTSEASASRQSMHKSAAMLTSGSTTRPAPSGIICASGGSKVFNFVHHHALDFTDGVVFHVAKRRVQETIRQAKPQPFQHVIRHVVGNAGGQRERGDTPLHGVGRERPQAPAGDFRRAGRARRKQTDDPVTCSKTAPAPP